MTAVRVTKDQLIAMEPCSLDDRLALFGKRKTLTASVALKAGVSIRDVLWVAVRLGRRDLCVKFALACAQRVVHLDKTGTAQPCLDAAYAYVADDSAENLAALRKARSSASAASAAAAAAAYAAYAAAYAYAAAANAANAAAYAAYAADARQKEIDAQRALFVEIFG